MRYHRAQCSHEGQQNSSDAGEPPEQPCGSVSHSRNRRPMSRASSASVTSGRCQNCAGIRRGSRPLLGIAHLPTARSNSDDPMVMWSPRSTRTAVMKLRGCMDRRTDRLARFSCVAETKQWRSGTSLTCALPRGIVVMVSVSARPISTRLLGPGERLLRHGAYSMTGEPETEAEGDRIGDAGQGCRVTPGASVCGSDSSKVGPSHLRLGDEGWQRRCMPAPVRLGVRHG
jgi:hypothetical protein